MDLLRLLEQPARTIRIPDSRSVALPTAFCSLVDHPDVQRLRRVRAVGPIHLVYPGAVHTRFEHSLGVFWAAAEYLRGLWRHDRFRERVDEDGAKTLLAAALLHDIGHYPYAHSLEALHSRAFSAPRHEDLAADMIEGRLSTGSGPCLGDLIEGELGVDRARVAQLVKLGTSPTLPASDQLLASIINSAIDADKLDYLERDSLHMGVPYGRMPDRGRLIENLTVNPRGTRIALTEKGRVSGEIFLFSRYLMFSEAYWHHTVRAASAMIEGALADFVSRTGPDIDELTTFLLGCSDDELLAAVRAQSPKGTVAHMLLEGLSPNTRGLFKRVLTVSRQIESSRRHQAYERVYEMDSQGVAALAGRLRYRLAEVCDRPIADHELLIDTPPRDKDRMDSVEVVLSDGDAVPLQDMSSVVGGIAVDFIKVVKKIRVFVHPAVRDALTRPPREVEQLLLEEILHERQGAIAWPK